MLIIPGIAQGKYGPNPTSPEKFASNKVRIIKAKGSRYPLLILAKKATGVQSRIDREATMVNVVVNLDAMSADQLEIPAALPAISEETKKISASIIHHKNMTRNFEKTIYERETGKARISFKVLSEYSRPNTQLVTNPNPTRPIAAID